MVTSLNIPEHTYDVTWFDHNTNQWKTIGLRGIQDLSEFIRNCEANGRELSSVYIRS